MVPRAGVSRRAVLSHVGQAGAAALLGGAFTTLAPGSASAAAPYPANPNYRLRRLDTRWLWRVACESDQWPHVAIDSSRFIAGWGDGWGFHQRRGEQKSAIGFTQFSGAPTAPVIKDVWADSTSAPIRAISLKPQALLKVGNAIYVYANGMADDRDRTRLFRMPLDGSSFTSVQPDVVRRSIHGLQVVGSVHHKPLVDGDVILLLAEHGGLESALLYVGERKNPAVWAARVPSGALGDSRRWEWFCGRGGDGAPLWSTATVRHRVFTTGTGRRVVPVFQDPRGAGKHVMISRCPSLPGYVLAKTQNWLELGLFFGPTPFGPWTTLYYGPFVPRGAAPEPRIFTAQVVIKWSYGGILSLMWSGAPRPTACSDPASGNYDAVHLTRFAVERI
jgi:hypothetical protein